VAMVSCKMPEAKSPPLARSMIHLDISSITVTPRPTTPTDAPATTMYWITMVRMFLPCEASPLATMVIRPTRNIRISTDTAAYWVTSLMNPTVSDGTLAAGSPVVMAGPVTPTQQVTAALTTAATASPNHLVIWSAHSENLLFTSVPRLH